MSRQRGSGTGAALTAIDRSERRFALLSATNRAVLKARNLSEMFQMVCEAATGPGKLFGASVALHVPGSPVFTRVAYAGRLAGAHPKASNSVDRDRLDANGVAGEVFRSGLGCFVGDMRTDPRPMRSREQLVAAGVTAGAILPLNKGGRTIGVCSFFFDADSGPLDEDRIELTTQIAENISFGAELFERQEQRETLARLFEALSDTNEAMVRARTREEMLERVCRAAARGGDFLATLIGVPQEGSDFLRIVATAGPEAARAAKAKLSVRADLPEGQGLTGQAFRSGGVCLSNDYANDMPDGPLRAKAREQGCQSAAALPLMARGRPIGVLFFMSNKRSAYTPELVALLERLAENVAFALANFERAAERRREQIQKGRLTDMFAALSETNEAIMRAGTRAELIERVCKAAVRGGPFMLTAVALVEPGNSYLRVVAAGGSDARIAKTLRLATTADLPEGRGLAGTAFRTRQTCVSNDYLSDPRTVAFHAGGGANSVRSCAALPLLNRGEAVGLMILVSNELNAFTPDLVALLERLADNVSFAFENFDRADDRLLAERQQERLTRMYTALSATNEAIMRAGSRDELFALVCEAAVNSADFGAVAIALSEPGTPFLRDVATAGPIAPDKVRAAITEDLPQGRGMSGTAFRSRRPCFSNDYLTDARCAAFHASARSRGIRSLAALPLVAEDCSFGVLVFQSKEIGAFTPDLVALLERLADNVSFALQNFDRADERLAAEQQRERLTRMYTALSATNEAIMRAGSRDELFALVCEAAVQSGDFATVAIALADPGSDYMRDVAIAGPVGPASVVAAVNAALPEGRGMSGLAFRTGEACISNDYLVDPRGAAFHDTARARGIRSLAALPLLSEGRVLGVLVFQAREIGAFTPDLVELLQRMTANVGFALENFDRADDRRLAREQKERLTRMFVALSATNEAIMRASTRAELFGLVCDAAVQGGRFASTIIALSEEGSDFMRVVAWAGPQAEHQKSVRLAITDAHPEGRGISGTAFRTMQPCIINDYLGDSRGSAFHRRAAREGNQAGAALPLITHGQAVGVLVFMSSERDAFTPELVELLSRLANNVSFALENFDRAEEKARADERIQYLATHDGLTGLPNRAMFNQLLRGSLEAARGDQRNFAVLFIDIDRFKVINDSLGHDAGDALLTKTAERLRGCLGARDAVARLGGDEFVVILGEAGNSKTIEAAARSLLGAICEPLQLCGLECRATASIGIAVYPGDGEDEATLTKNADMAMYRAKEEGKNGFRFFMSQNKTQSVERLVFEARLRQALERDEFSLAYQPKVDAVTSKITGVEALLRWTLPDLGALSPMQFIPLAEETGLIVPIGRWVLRTACEQAMAWRRQGLPLLSMAVNLSPRQFSDDNLLADIDDALAASGLPPELLQLEITESMMMHNVARAIELLEIIRGRGVRLAIDDFGTGYSSMSLMKKFPVDTIKIDRSFVKDLPDDAEDRAIAQAIISMGKALGLTIVAEGVETIEQAAFLRGHECDEMQGYLFSRPVAPEFVPALVDPARLAPASLRALSGAGRAARGAKNGEGAAPPRGRSGARAS